MKKLVFLLAVAFSAALYSCGNKAEETANEAAEAANEATEQVTEAAGEIVEVVDSLNDTIQAAVEEVVTPAE